MVSVRLLQFSLRSLLVLTLIFAIAFGLVSSRLHRKRQEQAAVEAIKRFGGMAWYDFSPQDAPRGPAWARKLVGDDFFWLFRFQV